MNYLTADVLIHVEAIPSTRIGQAVPVLVQITAREAVE